MEKKGKKGLFSSLFAPKANTGCCNVQFEEITDEQISNEEQVKDSENKDKDNKDNPESKKGNNSCCCDFR